MKKRINSGRKAQVTIFVIIAIILVVGIAGFFILRNVYQPSIPASVAPIYNSYISCIDGIAETGALIMGSQAGYIELPEFSAGNEYSPFSNQLNFMGFGIPYWYYISGNGISKQQVPSKALMETQLENYIESEILRVCDLEAFEREGYNISASEEGISADVKINDDTISVAVNQRIVISIGEDIYTASSHSSEIQSNLGRFYNLARDIYSYEESSMFLENYSVDVLQTYAPVSGTIFECSPAIWNPYDVFGTLQNALQANIGSLRMNGEYYNLKRPARNYFVAGKESSLKVDNAMVNFLYSKEWPSRFEVWPTENNIMMAQPIGMQEGLGVMGFCYVPYKFVYDMYFPVLVQILSEDGSEIFQFPVAVVINKNFPREAAAGEAVEAPVSDICANSNTGISVYTYNVNLEPVEAELKFKCFNEICNLGKTKLDSATGYSSTDAAVPQCANGILIANSEGYKEERYIISTNEESLADIIMRREYELPLEIYADGSLVSDLAVLSVGEITGNTTQFGDAVSYPYNNKIKISDGYYNFDLKVYGKTSFTIPSSTVKECAKVPQSGILGVFGFEEEKCFDMTIPSQTISNYVSAGGNTDYFISQSELENAKAVRIYSQSTLKPAKIEDVISAFDSVENKNIIIDIVQ